VSPQLEAVLRALQAEKRRAGPWREPGGWVFTSLDGRQLMGETVFNRGWQRLRRNFAKPGNRPLTLHSARHTWATLALRANKSIRWIAGQLGHSDPAITLRIYAHVLPDEGEALGFLDFDAGCSTSNSIDNCADRWRREASGEARRIVAAIQWHAGRDSRAAFGCDGFTTRSVVRNPRPSGSKYHGRVRSNAGLRSRLCRERHRAALGGIRDGPTALYGPSRTPPPGSPRRS
jgi:hypothetical protein